MVEDIMRIIPPDLVKFVLVTLFSLLIGLEQRRRNIQQAPETLFGTDRTFTFIGILGYVLYIISPHTLIPFLGGGAVIGLLLAIFYYQKINVLKMFGFTSLIIALITYSIAPLMYTQPLWLVLLILVTVLVLAEIKETLLAFSKTFDNNEFITLAKFLVLAGVILPLLPDRPISETINISPFKFGMAIVAVSGISYFSYLLKKFVFPKSGIILTGILGGLYSSTATTFILARKSKELHGGKGAAAAIILATTMMYLRLLLLAFFFNTALAIRLLPSFAVSIVVSALIAVYFLKFGKAANSSDADTQDINPHTNPLELKTSMVFAALFIVFAFVTGAVSKSYGASGINILSFVVGVTDIDPFIINVFQSKWNIENTVVIMAVLNAISSNNLLKIVNILPDQPA